MRDLFSFNTFIFPKLAKILFGLGAVVILCVTAFQFVGVFQSWNSFGTKVLMAVGVLLAGGVGVLLLRIMTEIMLVLFSINSNINKLAEASEK